MMMDDPPFEPDKALAARWLAVRDTAPATPDALTLAAYAEGRLDDAAAEAVEAALAADPDLLDTLLALRAPPEIESASAALILSAQSLVRAEPVVVPFPSRKPAPSHPVKAWFAWGAVAASLLLVSVAGFNMGLATGHPADAATAGDESPSDLLDLSGLTGDDIG
jgi:anti-sigma factor RsiW